MLPPARSAPPASPAPASLAVVAALAAAALLAACGSRSRGPSASPPLEWRLVPGTTVLGERRQFFVYGQGLDSARVAAPAGMVVEQGEVKPGGKVLSVYLTVGAPVPDDTSGLAAGKGRRAVRVVTPDTAVTFALRVLDER